MKSGLTVVLFRLFTIGVFVGGKESNGELVSVTEGDSVTLRSGVTEIQINDEIEWEFNGSRLATISIDSGNLSEWIKPDGPFRNRLQLDNQTGDLKISDIKTTDSGLYKPTINSPRGSPPEMTFTVKVVFADEVKTVSVMEGDSVPLDTDPTYIQGSDVIRWRFEKQKSLVAEINRRAGIFNTYDDVLDGRFRDRLKLDHQTGSLNITNTRTTDSGLYEVEISSTRRRYTTHHTQSFSVTVRDEVKSVSVLMGDSVTLRTGLTKRQIIEQIQWKFEDNDEPIADLIDLQTGDLTIKNIQRDQYGYYNVEIKTRTIFLHRKYQITMIDVFGEVMSAMEGNRVTLNTGVTKKSVNDTFLWYFNDTLIAQINDHPEKSCLYYGKDEIFKDRLDVDYKTGSLIITTSRPEHTGRYQAEFIEGKPGKTETIIRSSKCESTKIYPKRSNLVIHKSFILIVGGSGVQSGSGAVAWIVVAVVVLLAAAGFVYYHRKISDLERQIKENGVNLNTKKTDDHATEESKLPTDS